MHSTYGPWVRTYSKLFSCKSVLMVCSHRAQSNGICTYGRASRGVSSFVVCQAMNWANADLLTIGELGTNASGHWISQQMGIASQITGNSAVCLISKNGKISFAILALCKENTPASGGFPSQRDSNTIKVPTTWRQPGFMSYVLHM